MKDVILTTLYLSVLVLAISNLGSIIFTVGFETVFLTFIDGVAIYYIINQIREAIEYADISKATKEN